MLLKGGIIAQPLEKTRRDGTLYHRPKNIEAAIDAALTQDLTTQCERALIRDYGSADYLPSECLLHLIRNARRRDDEAAYNALLPLLLARCEANLNSHVASTIPGARELRRDSRRTRFLMRVATSLNVPFLRKPMTPFRLETGQAQ